MFNNIIPESAEVVVSASQPANVSEGLIWFNPTTSQAMIYASGAFVAMTAGSTALQRDIYVAGTPSGTYDGNLTTFPSNYVVATPHSAVEVYMNGIHMTQGVDITANTGTTIVFATPVAAADEIVCVSYGDVENTIVGISYGDPEVQTYLTNNNYATATDVATAVTNLIDAAPGSLDTLNEIADSLNNDNDFAGTMTTQLATKFASADFDSTFDTRLATKTTADVAEATADNKYVTDLQLAKLIGIEDAATADQTDVEIKTAYENNADTNAFTDADHTKLDGIEAAATADQTGAEIKALYEGEADTNAFVDADRTKLDGIEDAATGDQTATEIESLYESQADTNKFTDADHTKLDGIEALATADQTDSEIRAAVEAANDSNVFTDADHTKLNGIEDAATADQTDAEIRTAVEAATDSNVFTDADHTKLDGIETAATADQTGAEIRTSLFAESNTNVLTDALLTKLTNIEATATTDQTDAEIKTAYENNSDTNVFDDAAQVKLAAIEASATADQTGAEIKSLYEAEADTNALTDARVTVVDAVTSYGVTFSQSTDASAARTTLGLGDVATTAIADYATAAQGSTADTALQNLTTTAIGTLQDVTVASVADADVLQYNTAAGVWQNKSLSNAGFSTVATSNSYTDLDNLPTITAAGQALIDDADVTAQRTTLGLATVAVSADYSDLVNTPTNVSTFTNDANYLVAADVANSLLDGDFTSAGVMKTDGSGVYTTEVLATVASSGDYTDLSGVPTNVSAFTNDATYQTAAQVTASIATVIDAAPAALDTLNELAASLNDDADFAGSMTTALAAKVDDSQISTFALTFLDDADAAAVRATLDVDQAGANHSVDVTLAGSYDYLTLSNQEITLGQIDATTDISGLGTMAVETATDYVATADLSELVDDRVSTLIVAGDNITSTYDDTANTLTIAAEGSSIIENVKNVSGSLLTAGTVVYQSGSTGTVAEVQPADNTSASTMPAIGVILADIAISAEGEAVLIGKMQGMDTSSFSAGDTLYVGTSGALTATKPAGEGALVQNFAKVNKVHSSNGVIIVTGAGRANATPNLNSGNIFLGNSSNEAVTASLDSSVTAAGFIKDYTPTEAEVTAHQAALTITESQISDLNHREELHDLDDVNIQSVTDGQVLVYNASQSRFENADSEAVERTVTEFVVGTNSGAYTSGSTTEFPVAYQTGKITVYVNGVRLGTSDFTASNNTSVVLSVAANVGDEIALEAFSAANVIDTTPNYTTVTATTGAITTVNSTTVNATTVDATTVEADVVDLGNWTLQQDSNGDLLIKVGGVNTAKIDASGNLSVIGNVSAYATL